LGIWLIKTGATCSQLFCSETCGEINREKLSNPGFSGKRLFETGGRWGIAGINFHCATKPHLADFAHEIRIQRIRILAASVTSRTAATVLWSL